MCGINFATVCERKCGWEYLNAKSYFDINQLWKIWQKVNYDNLGYFCDLLPAVKPSKIDTSVPIA